MQFYTAMTIHKNIGRRLLFYLCFFCAVISACTPLVMTEPHGLEKGSKNDRSGISLTGEEILQTFANVRDDAVVQDAAKTQAVNHWYADGRFISRWSNGEHSGEVTGTWRVKNDLRCVTILTGLPKRVGQESCAAVFRRGSEYLSFNADGSIHGIHTLSPL